MPWPARTSGYANFSQSMIAPGGLGVDTGGNTAATSPRVGTHQTHMLGSSNLSSPMHCGECHTVHTTIADGTHLNYTTATVAFNGALARSGSHTPTASRTAGIYTCNNTYCHTGFRQPGAAAGQSRPQQHAQLERPGLHRRHHHRPTPAPTSATPCLQALGLRPIHINRFCGCTTSPASATCSCHSAVINTGANSYASIFSDKSRHIDGTSPEWRPSRDHTRAPPMTA